MSERLPAKTVAGRRRKPRLTREQLYLAASSKAQIVAGEELVREACGSAVICDGPRWATAVRLLRIASLAVNKAREAVFEALEDELGEDGTR